MARRDWMGWMGWMAQAAASRTCPFLSLRPSLYRHMPARRTADTATNQRRIGDEPGEDGEDEAGRKMLARHVVRRHARSTDSHAAHPAAAVEGDSQGMQGSSHDYRCLSQRSRRLPVWR